MFAEADEFKSLAYILLAYEQTLQIEMYLVVYSRIVSNSKTEKLQTKKLLKINYFIVQSILVISKSK